jgi:hypothetical protein
LNIYKVYFGGFHNQVRVLPLIIPFSIAVVAKVVMETSSPCSCWPPRRAASLHRSQTRMACSRTSVLFFHVARLPLLDVQAIDELIHATLRYSLLLYVNFSQK